ncbi:GDSL-type esterase/lipase family protein [Echinicola jeungdonensis]|uniref:GDSL-type esterase/lipase family protein n=1 Tax=Echinicola jeungdonensis TaxID=709343 RepID=A0ABV5J8B1_9BACT|nr:GDSL-type esterase/lipase family protein [Echinicola jeungdonensis]MDN3669489.1 GDSL-type esterase/lipase family protein [Echinicola jeungdonensis]
MSKISFLTLALSCGLSCLGLQAQDDPKWDDTQKKDWDKAFEKVEIPSSVDGKKQAAILYKAKSEKPKPLIVSLHTWSGDYTQKDPLAKEILARDWNYIHPDFRGPNNSPEAMGSTLVISDIADAIDFALENTNTDPNGVHIIGVSGGGYATLLAFMNLDYPVKSFSAWAPISDIEAWYWESVGRDQKYAGDILQALEADSVVFKEEEALKRSPIAHEFPVEKRKGSQLFIYEGIHDGYTGSVPITHSINMYNRLVGELKYGTSEMDKIIKKAADDPDLVSPQSTIELLTKRMDPNYDPNFNLFGRNIYLYRNFGNISLTLFEGGHEQLPQALSLIPIKAISPMKANILTLGDSNGEHVGGWVDQLKEILPQSKIVNISKSGRTIGFDNLGRTELNALKNIQTYLNEAEEEIGNESYDYILLCLGTNDTKSVFAERQDEVVINFEKLVDTILEHDLVKKEKAQLLFITPPPIRTENIIEKYQGGNERLAALMPKFKSILEQREVPVVDVFNPLQGVLDYYAEDGVHMSPEGQEIIAGKILDRLKNY